MAKPNTFNVNVRVRLVSQKLYIWRDVLCDYSCGMAFAVAESLEEAGIAAATDKDGDVQLHILEQLHASPQIIDLSELDGPVGAYVYGGG